jgi:hypothetical protein
MHFKMLRGSDAQHPGFVSKLKNPATPAPVVLRLLHFALPSTIRQH